MVIALDKGKRPLGFITERRARKLMEAQRACVYRYFPFVLIIKDVDARQIPNLPEYRIKIDPGADTDGISIIHDNEILFAMHIQHRGRQVTENMTKRKNNRRNRRNRETRYRRSKFAKGGTFEHTGSKGKLPPSANSVIGNTKTWIRHLCSWINITKASFEAVRFDTQLMDNPEIEGEQYQHGTLHGTEVREYLLDHYQHTCQYCGGKSGDPILEWEHINKKSRGGADTVKNATLSCRCCNQEKGNHTPKEWKEIILAKPHKTKLDEARLEGIDNVMKHTITGGSNRYCAWTNISRKELERFLFDLFDEVECSTGGKTKYNRVQMGFLKNHQYDAACIGDSTPEKYIDRTHGYYVKAIGMGRGTRFRGQASKCGIITVKYAPRERRVFGFMSGDIVAADVPHRTKRPFKYEGRYTGRVMTRANGSFDIRTLGGDKVTVRHDFCRIIQYVDGYQYRLCRTTEKTCQDAKRHFSPGH